jgi:hypothetical protein
MQHLSLSGCRCQAVTRHSNIVSVITEIAGGEAAFGSNPNARSSMSSAVPIWEKRPRSLRRGADGLSRDRVRSCPRNARHQPHRLQGWVRVPANRLPDPAPGRRRDRGGRRRVVRPSASGPAVAGRGRPTLGPPPSGPRCRAQAVTDAGRRPFELGARWACPDRALLPVRRRAGNRAEAVLAGGGTAVGHFAVNWPNGPGRACRATGEFGQGGAGGEGGRDLW